MQEVLGKIPEIIQLLSVILMIISILATIIVRLTPSKTDDEKVSKFSSTLMGVLHWLPTIGINPQTKKLQEAYEEIKKKLDENTKVN